MPNRSAQSFFFLPVLQLVTTKPWMIIAVIAVLTCFFAVQIPKLSFRTSVYDLLVEDLPDTAIYENLKAEFGSDEIILLVVKADNLFESTAFGKLEEISAKCTGLTGVRRVLSLAQIKKDIDPSAKMSLVQIGIHGKRCRVHSNGLIEVAACRVLISLIPQTDR